jgi:hypothetical protein
MSKDISLTKKQKQLVISELTRVERAVLDRKASHTALTNAVSDLPDYLDKGGALQKPNKEMLVRSFYKRIKDKFGMSCEEIDLNENVMMCNAVRTLREDGEYIISQYLKVWNGTQLQYDAMKAKLRNLVDSTKTGFDHRMKELEF